jgi:Flp pilus assembly protein TadG
MRKSRVNVLKGKIGWEARVSDGFLHLRGTEGEDNPGLLDQRGQVLPWAILLMMVFLGFCAFTVDIGHGLLVKRELQASCDAAALAAAEVLPSSTYATVAQNFSAMTGGKNTYGEFSVGTPTVTPLCLTTVENWPAPYGVPCTSSPMVPNAVQVTETATVHNFFAGALGMPMMTVSAMSTASKGGKPQPFNVAIVLDTTPSMNSPDVNCKVNGKTLTQLQCATNAFQALLLGLNPSEDSISLFTFPNVTTTTVGNDYNCNSDNPTVGPYTFPSTTANSLSTMGYTTGSGKSATTVQETYQVTDWSSNYRTSDTTTSLNKSNSLTNAVGGTSCTGIQTSYENTYYAGAIYAAQASLTAEAAARPGTQNAIIFLSDGNATAKETYPTSSFTEGGTQYSAGAFYPGVNDMVVGSESTKVATSGGSYPSWVGECSQGLDAANYAKGQGTQFYSIAYGSPSTSSSSNCGSDRTNGSTHKNITPCQTMQQMSSGWSSGDYSYFYSDYFGGNNGCAAAGADQAITDLQQMIEAILGHMSGARLIPNGTT